MTEEKWSELFSNYNNEILGEYDKIIRGHTGMFPLYHEYPSAVFIRERYELMVKALSRISNPYQCCYSAEELSNMAKKCLEEVEETT